MYNFIKILNTDRLEDKGKESCTYHTWTIKYKIIKSLKRLFTILN